MGIIEHSEAIRALINVFNAFSIRYFLIGAQVRDMYFNQKNIPPKRATRDIDFAVMAESMERYENLMAELSLKGFEKTKEPYRLMWRKDGTIIDLIPFGKVESDHLVRFDRFDVELTVMGYSDLIDDTTPMLLDEKGSLSIPVPPLHGLFLLKLLSWNDNRSNRDKDLDDMIQILDNYWEFVEDEAYKYHLDLFETDNFNVRNAAAHILGRHLKKMLDKSDDLRKVVISILEEQTQQTDPPGQMIRRFSYNQNLSLEKVKTILEEILKGIYE